MKERVLVAMSGGVDSSVAAAMLVEQGYDVVGATMKLFCHGEDLPDRPCCSLDSVNDARRICQQLGIPHYVLNLESAFGRDVVDDFVAEYDRGRTPTRRAQPPPRARLVLVEFIYFVAVPAPSAKRRTPSMRSGSPLGIMRAS